jgi:prephenate dehydratase
MRVAFQGELGAFSELAVAQLWGPQAEPVPCREFDDVLRAVAEGAVDAGVIPVENTTVGRIPGSAEALRAFPTLVQVDETVVRVHPCLLAPKGIGIRDLRRVHSHPAALAQCSRYFHDHPWLEAVRTYDTAGAARDVARHHDGVTGVIAGRPAAVRYGLAVLEEDIADTRDNDTRFVAVSRSIGGSAGDQRDLPT